MAWCDGLEEPRVLIAPVPSSNAEGCFLSLRHPKSGEETCYLLMDGHLHEFNWFKQSYGSWFIGDYVCEDGSLYMCTPVDPIFILLPVFDSARMSKGMEKGKFRQIEEILYVEGYPGYQCLESVAYEHMQMVCEVKEVGSEKFFRLDNSKVIAWLFCKVQSLKEVIPKLGKNYAAQEERAILKDVVLLLDEYLKDDPWLLLLCRQLQLDIQDLHNYSNNLVACGETTPASYALQGNTGSGNTTSSKGKQPKKLKVQVDSQNIKDMFRRATRKRNPNGA